MWTSRAAASSTLFATFVIAAAASTALWYIFSCKSGAHGVRSSTRITLLRADNRINSSVSPMTADYAADADAAVAAAWEIPFNATAPIPMQLWQTSRTSNFSNKTRQMIASWQLLNARADLPHYLHDDKEAARFVRDFYGKNAYKVYESFPLGVMRADFWRYAILYAHGGIYADIDARCLKPVRDWFPPRRWQHTRDRIMFVSNATWKSPGGLESPLIDKHD